LLRKAYQKLKNFLQQIESFFSYLGATSMKYIFYDSISVAACKVLLKLFPLFLFHLFICLILLKILKLKIMKALNSLKNFDSGSLAIS